MSRLPIKVGQRLLDHAVQRQHKRAMQGPGHEELVSRLRAEFQALSGNVGASPFWSRTRADIKEHVDNRDAREFLTWEPIIQTMFVKGSPPFVRTELKTLKGDPDWPLYRATLREDPIGCPSPTMFWPRTSANLLHHVYHLREFRSVTPNAAGISHINEFGGGYGSFSRACRKFGYRGTYHIHDFPELSALQRYFLSAVALTTGRQEFIRDTSFGCDIANVPPSQPDSALFVALWSLSEVPPSDRAAWIDIIDRHRFVLIAYGHEFEGADNIEWFSALQNHLSSYVWNNWEIKHLPSSSYMIGCRR